MKVRWTEKATTDVIGIFDYIAKQSSGYADVVCEKILARPHQLLDHPRSGSIVPEYRCDDIREVLVHSFRIVYRISGTEVRILTVVHGSHLLPPEPPDEAEQSRPPETTD